MSDAHWIDWILVFAVSLSAAGLAVWLLRPRHPVSDPLHSDPKSEAAVLLFRGETLVDSSDGAEWLVRRMIGGSQSDWAEVKKLLRESHPGFPDDPQDIRDKGRTFVSASDGAPNSGVFCELSDGIVRVEVLSPCPEVKTTETIQPGQDHRFLRETLDSAPYPIWRIGESGTTTWANLAYGRLVRRLRGPDVDPHESIFPELLPDKKPGKKTRVSITADEHDNKLWYDVSVVRQPAGTLCFAVDINAVVDAEIAQRNFVQTLAKTFAQLSIGLAIFDRNRQLALFNPALIDLTMLPADFLSGRPNLLTFFDRLRDRKMMPEPKNYGSWRDQMAELVAAATDGRYQETWSLPSGSVYSVSGRPHPDGAIAFLFEDITAEITLTRRFRSELEQGQSVLDQLDDAIAVFAPDGTLTFSNLAYNALWTGTPDSGFSQVTILDTTRCWQDQCLATPAWGDIRDFVSARENRSDWWTEVQLRSGAILTCHVCPIASGATMVRFVSATGGAGAIAARPVDSLVESAQKPADATRETIPG